MAIHTDISAEAYHADPAPEPSLSSSVAKILVNLSPAHARIAHPRLNPDYRPRSRAEIWRLEARPMRWRLREIMG